MYQKGGWFYERIMWLIFTIVLLAGAAGLFGSGYFNSANEGQSTFFKVQYSRFLRYETDSRINFEINAIKSDKSVSLWIDSDILNYFMIQQIAPLPDRTLLKTDQIVFTYDIEPSVLRIQIALLIKPMKLNRIKWHAGLVGGSIHEIAQFIYP